MRDLQSAGTEILTGNPQRLYIFCGSEYGIKKKYLELIADKYNNNVIELQTVEDVISKFSHFQLIPPVPSLYIVRYDLDFISKLTEKTAHKLTKCQVIGTLVLIYQDDKHETKLDKYLGDYCISLDKVSQQFMMKHLSRDYPKVPEDIISYVVRRCIDYNQSDIVCSMLSEVEHYSEETANTFIYNNKITLDKEIKLAIASRSYSYLCSLIDKTKTMNDFVYPAFSLMLELEKARCAKYQSPEYKKFLANWSFEDIYNYYNIVYQVVLDSRTNQVVSDKDACLFLASLLIFKSIPKVSDLF